MRKIGGRTGYARAKRDHRALRLPEITGAIVGIRQWTVEARGRGPDSAFSDEIAGDRAFGKRIPGLADRLAEPDVAVVAISDVSERKVRSR